MWYYIKQSFFAFIYLIFSAVISFAVLLIGDNLLWLKIILCLLNLGLYGFIVGAASYKDGQQALKTRFANDLERMQIIKTGEDRPLKLKEEYKPWKGFVFGAIACAPLVILLIIHTVLILAAGSGYNGAGVAASMIYMLFFAFFRLKVGINDAGAEVAVISPATYYLTLIAVPVIMLLTGIPYILGARKVQRIQDSIKEKQHTIYGD